MKNFTFKINENNYNVKIVSHEGNMIDLEVNGTAYSVKMKEEISTKKTPTLVRKPLREQSSAPVKVGPTPSASGHKVLAPIPGVIFSLKVKIGDTVKKNDLLCVLEAMKMENNILAEHDGVVKAINVTVGQQVLQDQVMIELE